MIFARVGVEGSERPAARDADGRWRDIGGLVHDIDAGMLPAINEGALEAAPCLDEPVRFGVPVAHVGKFVAIGLNYVEHAAEGAMAPPDEPIVFMKAVSCLSGPSDDVPLPRGSTKMDWEVELGVVIGRKARYIDEAAAMDFVAGFVLVNDLSEREDQLERGGTWDKGKSHDRFGPVGPFLVTPDSLGDWGDVRLTTRVNGEVMQDGLAGDMIFGVPRLIAYCSRFMTLEPGDIIATGTPPGVGLGKRPRPVFLREGDRVQLSGGALGTHDYTIAGSV